MSIIQKHINNGYKGFYSLTNIEERHMHETTILFSSYASTAHAENLFFYYSTFTNTIMMGNGRECNCFSRLLSLYIIGNNFSSLIERACDIGFKV